MKKEVVKVGGDSLGIRFTTAERAIYKIDEGDVIDISSMVVSKKMETSK